MKNIVLEEQMELTLAGAKMQTSGNAPSRRAGWWFSRMRNVVDKAIDRKPRATPRSHQVYLTLEGRFPNW